MFFATLGRRRKVFLQIPLGSPPFLQMLLDSLQVFVDEVGLNEMAWASGGGCFQSGFSKAGEDCRTPRRFAVS